MTRIELRMRAFPSGIVFPMLDAISLKSQPAHATASVLALNAGEVDENIFTR